MNTTTTGCAVCRYYFNGICSLAEPCYGLHYSTTENGFVPLTVEEVIIYKDIKDFICKECLHCDIQRCGGANDPVYAGACEKLQSARFKNM